MKINEFIDVIILGAGAPSIGKTPSPLKQLSIRDSVIEWQLDCFSVIENLRNVYDNPNTLEGINNVTGDIVFEPIVTKL